MSVSVSMCLSINVACPGAGEGGAAALRSADDQRQISSAGE